MSTIILLSYAYFSFFFNATATTEIYTLSLHDALPILFELATKHISRFRMTCMDRYWLVYCLSLSISDFPSAGSMRSEEHTSELQSLAYLVCRLLLEKKKITNCPSSACRMHSSSGQSST